MIKGIVSAVPSNVILNTEETFMRVTGVRERRIAPPHLDVGDYAILACDKLMACMDWSAADLSAIIFVTQTPQVRMPAMACKMAGALDARCAAFDVSQACAGYLYGLWLASKIGGHVLLIAGDTVSRMCDINDKSTYPLFGDAVTATAIEAPEHPYGMETIVPIFRMGADGSGFSSLYADPLIKMQGSEVMNFAIQTVPKLVADTTMNAHVDWHFFHQANEFLLKHIVKKCGIAPELAPMNIAKYGNTSSASIPLLMTDSAATPFLKSRSNRVGLYGFGAGFSYGGVMLDLEPLQVAEVIEV